MSALSKDQVKVRERTLLIALLLSMWGPLATGIAVLMSRSTTQIADFVRRSVELVALFVSWWVYRRLNRGKTPSPDMRVALENSAALCVAAALTLSGIVMFVMTIARTSTHRPGGNVYPGLAIACLGLVTNSWFWRRYTVLAREQYSTVIDSQRYLYRAKAYVDICVIVALLAVAVRPEHLLTRYVDSLGSLAVSVYLVVSGVKTARSSKQQSNSSTNKEEC